jgi:hypothetical protein
LNSSQNGNEYVLINPRNPENPDSKIIYWRYSPKSNSSIFGGNYAHKISGVVRQEFYCGMIFVMSLDLSINTL